MKKYYNQYTYEDVKNICEERGLKLLDAEYINCKQKLTCVSQDGYYVYTTFENIRTNNINGYFHKSNPYTIQNINIWCDNHNIKSKCISDEYVSIKSKLKFRCECGNIFITDLNTFKSGHKNKCDKCTGYHVNMSYEDIKNNLLKKGYNLLVAPEDYHGITLTDLTCEDYNGYKYKVVYDSVMRGKKMETFSSGNPYIIDNINTYLKKRHCDFTCISSKYINSRENLKFMCNRCGEIVYQKWSNINRNDEKTRNNILCPNCDGRTESIHALVLKQIFLHNYPDTIPEDKSCINPKTNRVMPTDIVNHRLKIAIEIQSQWHDFPDIVEKGKIKKQFWLDKGYKFYDPDIRDYSVLEMCQIFFDINELPDYINYDYSNKINIKKVQDLLNCGKDVKEISNELSVSPHRIYDALQSKKLFYPKDYQRKDQTPVIQFDLEWNYINEYKTINEAGIKNNVNPQNISSALNHNRFYSSGFNWMKKSDYLTLQS